MLNLKAVSVAFLLIVSPFHLACKGKPDPKPGTDPGELPAPTRPAKKLALLVGIDKYRHTDKVSNLSGCENDVEDMKALLTGKFEFKQEDIKVLKSSQATHEAIVKAFQEHLIGQAQRDDIVVFHYSGHGSQMPDVSGDEIDGLDESLVCHDSRDPEGKVFDVSDDEVNGLLKQLTQKTKNITFIFDSCHSGTAIRAAGLVRKAPTDNRVPPSTPPAYALGERGLEGESDFRAKNVNYVLISGCLSKESSFEHKADNQERGALTYFLTAELRTAGAGATYRDVMDKVMGQVSANYPNQHPQLEGAAADNFVFSDSTSIAQAYTLVTTVSGDKVTLNAGQVNGMTVGSVFEVYAAGTKEFEPPQKPVGRVKLTNVLAFTSEGTRVSGNPIPQFSRAVEREHQYADFKLQIYYHGLSQSATLRAAKAELEKFKFIATVPEVDDISNARGYHLLLRQEGNQIVTEAGDTSELSPRVPADSPAAVATIVDQVSQWAKWFNLLSINNPGSANKIHFTVKVISEKGLRDPFANLGKAEDTLKVGEQFEFTIENRASQDLYISILDLSMDGSVSVLYPFAEGAGELLKKGTSLTTERFRATLPNHRPDLKSVMDVIKVFATSKPIDLHFVQQKPVKGVEAFGIRNLNDPLEQLLGQAALSLSRGAEPVRVTLNDWATASRVYMVKQ